jgi:cytochrome-b5 reductase
MFARPALRQTANLCQNARLISTGPKLQVKESKIRLTPWITGAAVLGASIWILRPSHEGHVERYQKQKDAVKDAPKVFTGGDQGFVKLKLAKSEEVNKNTRHLVFEYDDPTAISGLSTACKLSLPITFETPSNHEYSRSPHKVPTSRQGQASPPPIYPHQQ